MHSILNRSQTIENLEKRDGHGCQWINCTFELNEDNPITIEHRIPRSKGGTDDLCNLELLCQIHNYYRANRDYENYELRTLVPIEKNPKPQKVKHRKPTDCCNEGRDLGQDDVCLTCGSVPQPYAFPRWAKLNPKDCSHSGVFWCWACSIGIYDRQEASMNLMIGD